MGGEFRNVEKIPFVESLLDTPCTAGARSAIDWSEGSKTENALVVDALRIDSKESPNCTFILIVTARTSIRWFSKIQKVCKKVVQNRVPGPTDSIP